MTNVFNKSFSALKFLCLGLIMLFTNYDLSASHEKGSSRFNLSSYSTSNNSLFLKDNKYSTVSANAANPSAIGFFDHTYKNKLIFGIDRTVTSLGTVSSFLTNNIYRAEIDVTVNYNTYTPGSLALTGISVVKTLTVSFSGFNSHTNSSAPTVETDLDVMPFGFAYQSFVKINAVRIYNSYSSNTPISSTAIPNNLFVELQYDAERYYDLNTSASTLNTNFSAQYLTGVTTGNEIVLNWYRVAGAEEYDLEWLWLDEYTYGNGGTALTNAQWSSSPVIDFKNNSTRVRTSQNSYSISNVYQSGHLFFRIRAVGRGKTPLALKALGNSPICDLYTNWTSPDTYQFPSASDPLTVTGTGIFPSTTALYYIDLRPYKHEENKNWVYNSVYAEEGKRKEVVSYFDGAQYNRQTVTKNTSDNLAIVGETYYDYIGHAALNALPTPVNDATIKFYQETVGSQTGFNFDINNQAYTKGVFIPTITPNTCWADAPGYSPTHGTGKYYSSNNPFQSQNYNAGYTANSENVGGTETFPFTQTEYAPDMTGKIARQGGAGEAFKVNHASIAKHDTKYLYGSVTQEELDRLFGSEAGYASRYTKNVVVDANGQLSISYINQEGKVVATALAGTKPSNVDPLYAVNGTTDLSSISTPLEVDLLNKLNSNDPNTPADNNQIDGNSLVFSEKIIVTTPQSYLFNYTALGSCYQACGGVEPNQSLLRGVGGGNNTPVEPPNLCYDCVYDLEFDIIDKCGTRPTGFTPILYTLGTIVGTPPTISNPSPVLDGTGGNNSVNFSFNQIIPVGTTSLSVNFLEIGEYTILKKLKVNQAALDWYLNDYLAKCPSSPAQYDQNESGNLNISGCELDCQECVEKLGGQPAFTANLMTQNPGMSQTDADAQYNQLVKECTEPCQYDSYCESAKQAMFTDLAPGGQYAQFDGNGTTFNALGYPVSIFNSSSVLPRNASGAPWKSPKYYLNTSVLDYVDANGNPDKVAVQLVTTGVYNPPLDPGAPVSAGPGINQYLVSPKYLANASDFVTNFKDSWAQSLLMFHPEYPYIDWCMKNSVPVSGLSNISFSTNKYNSTGTSIIGTNVYSIPPSSDQYDSLITAIDDLDDIASSASQNILFYPLTYDPYWNANGNGKYHIASNSGNPGSIILPNPAQNVASTWVLQMQSSTSASPVDFSSFAPSGMYFSQKTNKTANNRFYNYKGTGLSLYQYAALMATPLAQQFGQNMSALLTQLLSNTNNPNLGYYTTSNAPSGPNDPNYILSIKKPGSGSTDDSYKRKAWENFKTLYLAMKKEMQDEAAQSYVMNGPADLRSCNDCIGNSNFDENKVKYTTYGNLASLFLIPGNVTSIPWNSVGAGFNALILSFKNWYNYFGNSSNTINPNNKEQVCGLARKDLFKSKVKRYYLADDAIALGADGGGNTQASIYNQTGLCPNAYDLQNFLNSLVSNSILYSSTAVNLTNGIPAFSENLYKSILPVYTSPFTPANYTSSYSGLVLTSNIQIGSGNSGAITLTFPSLAPSVFPSTPSPIDWANYNNLPTPTYSIGQFSGLQPQSGTGNFLVNAVVSYYLNGNLTTQPIQLTGTSPFNLTGCSFIPPCKANGNGKALSALLNTFSANQSFPAPYGSSGYVSSNAIYTSPTSSPYSYVFTNTFKSLLETPGNSNTNWVWTYNNIGTKDITILDNTTTNKRLKVVFTFPTGYNEACIQSFQNLLPDVGTNQPGDFTAEAVVSNIISVGNCPPATTIIKGTLYIGTYSGSSWNYVPLKVGDCSFDLAKCNTPPHQVKKDMEAWASGNGTGFTSMLLSTSAVDVSGNILFTSLLRSYLNSAGTINSSQAPLQNYYYWLPDAANTNSTKIEGWLAVSQSATPPSSAPAGSCKIVVQKAGTSANSINTILGSPISWGITLFGATSNSSLYNFKLTSSLGTSDSLKVSTTCMPMRACESCVAPATILGSSTDPGVINVEDFSSSTPNYIFTNSAFSYNFVMNPPNNYNIQNQQYLHNNVWPGVSINVVNNTSGCNNYGGTPMTWMGMGFFPNMSTLSSSGNTSTFSKTFQVPTSGIYNIGFNGPGIIDSYGTVNIYFNNNLVFSQTDLDPNGPPYMSPGGTYFPNNYHFPATLVAGTNYNLKIEFIHQPNTCHTLIRVSPITASFQNPVAPQIPCVNNTAWPTDTMPTTDYEEPCAPYLQDLVDNTADEKYDTYIDSTKARFIRNYKAHCMNSVIENLMMKYNNTEYHYTLYYYDQAGNLARTVPPQGVVPINLTAIYAGTQTNKDAIKQDRDQYGVSTKQVYTHHNFLTTYTYNSLNQLVKQETPDAGISKFYYDNLGRLVASQNAEQKFQSTVSTNQKYSYTKYDYLGRVSMVGTLGTYDLDTYPSIPSGQGIRDVLSATNYPFNLTIAANSHKEVTQTFYGDDPAFIAIIPSSNFSNGFQDNLRTRVATVCIEDVYDGNNTTYNHATHFSYDIHGNVKELINDNPNMGRFANQRYKKLQYTYDLISGKVNSVVYQRGMRDMFVHSYLYDADNRITNVYTSRDSLTWDQDAKYYYYLHGPLARVELGQHKAQGLDYAYTLQGWIKGVNSEALTFDKDMGKDGYDRLTNASNPYNTHRFNARDGFGYSITYYDVASSYKDYKPVNNANATASTYFLSTANLSAVPDLFNGNIKALSASYLNPSPVAVTIPGIGTTINKYQTYAYQKGYKYDQLNRITNAEVIGRNIDNSNNWVNASNTTNELNETFKYDQNGNITALNRKSTTGNMDVLTYNYYDAQGNVYNPQTTTPSFPPTNKLAYVIDGNGASTMGDIGNQSSTTNYTYDKTGNLIADASENITSIGWTLYGKIKSITRSGIGASESFQYDASGNRISKKITYSDGSFLETFYARDAQGNVMAVYENSGTTQVIFQQGTVVTEDLRVKELNVYGSSRAGLLRISDQVGLLSNNVNQTIASQALANKRILGNKAYELGNHLGNVVSVISDRILPVDANADNVIDNFVPDMLSATDYYAFGSSMPGRNYTSSSYRYGFNGKENDPETVGTGEGTQDYGMRIYNPSLGRFLSVDPLTRQYPELTPYQFASNSPIQGVDLDGEELKIVVHYLDQHADGTTFVKSTSTSIDQNRQFSVGNDKYAATIVYYSQNGVLTKGETIPEKIDPKGPKPSAAYDYSEPNGEDAKKASEDVDYILNGENGNMFTRAGEIFNRDKNAADNEINVKDVEELKDVLARKVPTKVDKPDQNLDARKKKKEYDSNESEHKAGARKSTQQKHEEGQSRKQKDKGGEKGDKRRPYRMK